MQRKYEFKLEGELKFFLAKKIVNRRVKTISKSKEVKMNMVTAFPVFV